MRVGVDMKLKARELQTDKTLSDKILSQSKEMVKMSDEQMKVYNKMLENARINKITAQAIIDGLK